MHKEEHVRQRTRVCCEPPHIPVQNAVGRLNSVDAAIASRYSGDKWLVTKTYKEGYDTEMVRTATGQES